ncbi:hypothetical protein, partial [Paraburkholderia sp. RL17-373-BIF-A]|uniref:hypothetical protein n=1 Tax=Paraburkholderia sp. RL17-373-BIF-A TaxID=3031629 RepID=UPI0038BC7306
DLNNRIRCRRYCVAVASLLADGSTEVGRRNVRLESADDGRSVLLVDLDLRRPGIPREYCIEITAGELIALIRA